MPDIWIAAFNAVLAALMAYLGVRVSLHPPLDDSEKKRWKYGFVVIAIVAVALNAVQGYRNQQSQNALNAQLGRIEKNTKTPPTIQVVPPPAQVVFNPFPPAAKHPTKPVPPSDPKVVVDAIDLARKIDNVAAKYLQARDNPNRLSGINGQDSNQRIEIARKEMVDDYNTNYRERAKAARQRLLEEVTDEPVDLEYGQGSNYWNVKEYENPGNYEGLTAIAKNLRALAHKYKLSAAGSR